jgi:hypothetical protein
LSTEEESSAGRVAGRVPTKCCCRRLETSGLRVAHHAAALLTEVPFSVVRSGGRKGVAVVM